MDYITQSNIFMQMVVLPCLRYPRRFISQSMKGTLAERSLEHEKVGYWQ